MSLCPSKLKEDSGALARVFPIFSFVEFHVGFSASAGSSFFVCSTCIYFSGFLSFGGLEFSQVLSLFFSFLGFIGFGGLVFLRVFSSFLVFSMASRIFLSFFAAARLIDKHHPTPELGD